VTARHLIGHGIENRARRGVEIIGEDIVSIMRAETGITQPETATSSFSRTAGTTGLNGTSYILT